MTVQFVFTTSQLTLLRPLATLTFSACLADILRQFPLLWMLTPHRDNRFESVATVLVVVNSVLWKKNPSPALPLVVVLLAVLVNKFWHRFCLCQSLAVCFQLSVGSCLLHTSCIFYHHHHHDVCPKMTGPACVIRVVSLPKGLISGWWLTDSRLFKIVTETIPSDFPWCNSGMFRCGDTWEVS